MFSLDNVIDDLWPQARPTPWQKKLLKKLLHEEPDLDVTGALRAALKALARGKA